MPTPPHHNHNNSPPLPSSATRLASRHRPPARARARGGLDQQGVLVTAFPGALGLRVARKARFPRYKCDPKALGREEPCRLQRQHNEFRDGLWWSLPQPSSPGGPPLPRAHLVGMYAQHAFRCCLRSDGLAIPCRARAELKAMLLVSSMIGC